MRFVFRLPTLESIENFNRWAIARSFALLSLGLVTGAFASYVLFATPYQGSPKEIILYVSWAVILGLFRLRHGRRVNPHRASQVNALLFAVLMFIFILWFMLPRAGDTAYLWAAGFALGILGYFVVSYYFLRR